MLSVIISVGDIARFNSILKPSLEQTNVLLKSIGLPELDIIPISGIKTICENYNLGIEVAKYRIRAFIHEDVDLLEPNWVFKVLSVFAEYPDAGLVGFIGTTNPPEKGYWWWSGEQYIKGACFCREEKLDWSFGPKLFGPVNVESIDGFFMCTNRNVLFDENLNSENRELCHFLHLYDSDYCKIIKKMGYTIKVVPHKAWHRTKITIYPKEQTDMNVEEFYNKWNSKKQQ